MSARTVRPGPALAAAACAAAARFRKDLRLPRPLTLAALAALPAAVARALERGRVRSYATFVAHMWAYLMAFELPHDDHAAQRRRLRIHYPVAIDRALGRGVVPGSRLQALRRHRSTAKLLDGFFGSVYFAWTPQRHAALLWILWRRPERFARAAALVSATFDVTLAIQAAVPTAPPWYAAKYGQLQDPLRRVTVDSSQMLPLVPEQATDEVEEPNPWASMPSPHIASATMVALVLGEADWRAGAAGGAYAVALAPALVYLGEHYVIDLIAGVTLAAVLRAALGPGLDRVLGRLGEHV